MRLTDYEIASIRKSFKEIFKSGKIYLFGSRVDDRQKGGDIDLYIVDHNINNILESKLEFLVSLKQKIGYQKIDLIVSRDKSRALEKEALANGIEL